MKSIVNPVSSISRALETPNPYITFDGPSPRSDPCCCPCGAHNPRQQPTAFPTNTTSAEGIPGAREARLAGLLWLGHLPGHDRHERRAAAGPRRERPLRQGAHGAAVRAAPFTAAWR